MKRINQSQDRNQVEYHRGRNDAPVFEEAHQQRVELGRRYLKAALDDMGPLERKVVVDLGCGSGDISGPASNNTVNDVIGIDCVWAATKAQECFGLMSLIISPVEEVHPFPSDVLVMCEFLEHVDDPWKVVTDWSRGARYMVIGHPLDDEDGLEPGHSWSYTEDDFRAWFDTTGFTLREWTIFGMHPFRRMVCGWGSRGD